MEETPIRKLINALHDAEKQIDILCHGFNVAISPSWDYLVDKVITNVSHWEMTGELPKPVTDKTPFLIYPAHSKTPLNARYMIKANPLPTVLFNQFKEKFLGIIKKEVLPAMQKYKQEKPEINVDVFKPLLTIKIQ